MSGAALTRLAERLDRLERNQLANSVPQLQFSSVEDGGSIDVNDADGQTTMQIGGQFDGTYMAAVLKGPKPPTPAGLIVTPQAGALIVRWDGTFADEAIVPMDFSRVEIHVSTEPAFDPSTAETLRATIETPRGSFAGISLPGNVTHYVKLVARSLAGAASDPSVEVAGTPTLIADEDIADFALTVKKMHSLSHQLY